MSAAAPGASAASRSPAGGARCWRAWTLLPASGGPEASPRAGHSPEATPAPESVGEGPHGPGGGGRRAGGCRPPPRRYRPRSGAAAVGAICRRRPTPNAFRGRERAREPGVREGRGGGAASSSPLPCRGVGVGQQGQRPRRDTGCRRPGLRHGTTQSRSRHGGEGAGGGARPLPEPLSDPPSPSLPFALPGRGDPAEGARVRAGAAAGEAAPHPRGEPPAWPRVPFPGWRNPGPAPPVLSLPPFPSDSSMISYLKKN